MKKQLLTILSLSVCLTVSAQTKQPLKVYYVPFTEVQYVSLQKRILYADSLLATCDAKAKDISPARNILNDIFLVFNQSYVRKNTLQMVPLNKPKQ